MAAAIARKNTLRRQNQRSRGRGRGTSTGRHPLSPVPAHHTPSSAHQTTGSSHHTNMSPPFHSPARTDSMKGRGQCVMMSHRRGGDAAAAGSGFVNIRSRDKTVSFSASLQSVTSGGERSPCHVSSCQSSQSGGGQFSPNHCRMAGFVEFFGEDFVAGQQHWMDGDRVVSSG